MPGKSREGAFSPQGEPRCSCGFTRSVLAAAYAAPLPADTASLKKAMSLSNFCALVSPLTSKMREGGTALVRTASLRCAATVFIKVSSPNTPASANITPAPLRLRKA